MKMLVFGATGQVGWSLTKRAPAGVFVHGVGRAQVDLLNGGAAAHFIASHEADVVVNAAAYTAVDLAESEEAHAFKINADAPAEMARACAARGVPFIHLSTDYVFDGSGHEPRRRNDPTGPLNVYGRSKLAGEGGVLAAGGRPIILRTSWVFSSHGNNFLKTMLRLGRERKSLRIVADQVGGPTNAADIADAIFAIAHATKARTGVDGVYHFAGRPEVSWANFARAIFEYAGLDVHVDDIPSASYPTPARRPMNSRLDCFDVEESFSIQCPDWRTSLRSTISEAIHGAA